MTAQDSDCRTDWFIGRSLAAVSWRHRRNFVCDDGDLSPHFRKWWWLSPPLFKSGICNFSSNSKFHIKIPIFFLYFRQENSIFLDTRSVLWPKICRKWDSGRGSTPDPARGAQDAPPDLLVGWGSDTPLHTIVVPPNTKSWRRHWSPPLFKVKRQWLKTDQDDHPWSSKPSDRGRLKTRQKAHNNSGWFFFKSVNIWQSYEQERGCLMHFAHVANTLLKDEENARDVLAGNFAKYSPISKRNSRTLSNKPFLIWLLTTPSHLKYVATLPCN